MHDELVVSVLVQAFEAGAIAADAVHARGWVACEFDPFGLERVELRMDDSARKRNGVPGRAVEAAGGQPAGAAVLKGCGEPVAIAADGAFAEFAAGKFEDAALGKIVPADGPERAAAGNDQVGEIWMQSGAEGVNGRAVGELARFERGER